MAEPARVSKPLWPWLLVAVGVISLFALVRPEPGCQKNPVFYLRGTSADCAVKP